MRVFASKKDAVLYLLKAHKDEPTGTRVRLYVTAPNGMVVQYEFEKKIAEKFKGFEKVGTEETWELKTIHWETRLDSGNPGKVRSTPFKNTPRR